MDELTLLQVNNPIVVGVPVVAVIFFTVIDFDSDLAQSDLFVC